MYGGSVSLEPLAAWLGLLATLRVRADDEERTANSEERTVVDRAQPLPSLFN